MSYVHPFESGVRVMLVQRVDAPDRFAVARNDGKRAVALPEGYDGYTGVFYLDGWVGVFHPELPALSLNPLTDKFNLMDSDMEASFKRAYQPPSVVH